MTLEDMSRKFDMPVFEYSRGKIRKLLRKKDEDTQEDTLSDAARDDAETNDAGAEEAEDAGTVG